MMEINSANTTVLNTVTTTEMETFLDNYDTQSDTDLLKELEKAINENAEETTIKISDPVSVASDDILKEEFGEDLYDELNVPNETALLEETHVPEQEGDLKGITIELTESNNHGHEEENLDATESNNDDREEENLDVTELLESKNSAPSDLGETEETVQNNSEKELAIDQISETVKEAKNKADSDETPLEESSKDSEKSEEDGEDDDDVLDVMEGTGRYDDDEADNGYEEENEEVEDDYSSDVTGENGDEPPEKKRRMSDDSMQESELLLKDETEEQGSNDAENEKVDEEVEEKAQDENSAQSVKENDEDAEAIMSENEDMESLLEESGTNQADQENLDSKTKAEDDNATSFENDKKNSVEENQKNQVNEQEKVNEVSEECLDESEEKNEKSENITTDVENSEKNIETTKSDDVQLVDLLEKVEEEKKEENPVEGVVDEILKCSENVPKATEQKENDIKRPHSPETTNESNKRPKSEPLQEPKLEKIMTRSSSASVKTELTEMKPKLLELKIQKDEDIELKPKVTLKDIVPVPIQFMKQFKKEIKQMSRNDLEELVVTKLIQSISNQCVITDLRQHLQKQEGLTQSYQQKCQELTKQFNDLTMVTNRLGEDLSKNNKNYTTPVKITRAVGLQVGAASKSKPDPRFLKPVPAVPARAPRAAAAVHHNYKPTGNTSPRASASPNYRLPANMPQNLPAHQQIRSAPPSPVNIIRTAVSPVSVAQTRHAIPPIINQIRNSTTNSVMTQVMRNVVSPGASAAVAAATAAAATTNGQISPIRKKSSQKITPMRPVLTEAVQQMQQQQQKLQQEQLIKNQIAQIQNNKQLSVIPNHQPPSSVAFSPVGTPVRTPSPASVKPQTPTTPKPLVKDDSCIDLTDDDDKPKPPASAVNGSPKIPPLAPIPVSVKQTPSSPNPGNRMVPSSQQPQQPNIGPRAMPQQPQPNAGSRAMQQLPSRFHRPMVHRMAVPNGAMMNARMPNGQMMNDPRRYNTVQFRHPARLPLPGAQPTNSLWKLAPPKPQVLRINNIDTGIVISWTMEDLTEKHANIISYQIYAYQETNAVPQVDMWRHVGDVKAMLLPMAVTLTQFQEGQRYHFAIRAVDEHSRVGVFSAPRTWSETA